VKIIGELNDFCFYASKEQKTKKKKIVLHHKEIDYECNV